MDTTNTNQLNKILDMYLESNEILQEQIASNEVHKHTVNHIKAKLKRCLDMIPTEKYEDIRKELYDALQVLKM
jgi:hypothetical protein